jgi:hypothetical protein
VDGLAERGRLRGVGLGTVLADYLDVPLDDIAATNLAKLAGRQGRGVLAGSGDDR